MRDSACDYCQLVCSYCQKEVSEEGGDIHTWKQHFARARENVKPCLKVFDDLKAEMLGHIDAFHTEKGSKKKVAKKNREKFRLGQFGELIEGLIWRASWTDSRVNLENFLGFYRSVFFCYVGASIQLFWRCSFSLNFCCSTLHLEGLLS